MDWSATVVGLEEVEERRPRRQLVRTAQDSMAWLPP